MSWGPDVDGVNGVYLGKNVVTCAGAAIAKAVKQVPGWGDVQMLQVLQMLQVRVLHTGAAIAKAVEQVPGDVQMLQMLQVLRVFQVRKGDHCDICQAAGPQGHTRRR